MCHVSGLYGAARTWLGVPNLPGYSALADGATMQGFSLVTFCEVLVIVPNAAEQMGQGGAYPLQANNTPPLVPSSKIWTTIATSRPLRVLASATMNQLGLFCWAERDMDLSEVLCLLRIALLQPAKERQFAVLSRR